MKNILASTALSALAIGFASNPAAAGGKRTPPVLTGVAAVKLPPRASASRGSSTLYPFEELTDVGMSFGVKDKDARALSSIVSNQNRKHRSEVKDATGAVTQTIVTKRFEARDVDAEIAKLIKGTALEGSKALVTRIEPNPA